MDAVSPYHNPNDPEWREVVLRMLKTRQGVDLFWQQARDELALEDDMVRALGTITGFPPFLSGSEIEPDPHLLSRISKSYALSHRVLPIRRTEECVLVATTTPFLGTVYSELASFFETAIEFQITQPSLLEQLTHKAYEQDGEIDSNFDDGDWEEVDLVEDLKDQAQAAPIIKLVNRIFREAIRQGVSDIHIDPNEEALEVRYRIDGMLQNVFSTSRKFQPAIISRIKIISDLDIAERRIPQDGRISLKLDDQNFDIRVATIPTVFGEGVVMRVLDKSSVMVELSQIGFSEEMGKSWDSLINSPNGVVLVTGPTGSGKTTSLYATLNKIKDPSVKMITAEDPVEYQLMGIEQVQVNAKVGLTFAKVLRSMLRLDPDILMVGEIRDQETAEIAVQAALTGHLVFSTLHTNNAPAALTRLIEMGIEPYLVGSALKGILAQRLVRKLCQACKSQDTEGQWQAVGCGECSETGYKGRIGVYELMVLSDEIREMLAQKKDSEEITRKARAEGMRTLWEDGMDKVESGLTTVSEIRRVTSD